MANTTKPTPSSKPSPASKTSASKQGSSGKPQDAIALLKADHLEVKQLFADYEIARLASSKQALIEDICVALTIHIQIEEEIFYPAVKSALKDHVLVPEAIVEHNGVRGLIAQLEAEEVKPDQEMVDARVAVLSEYVKHHVMEEQEDMFPQVKASSIDLTALGAQMAARKEELMAQMA